MKTNINKHLIAVYGTLRVGQSNNRLIANGTYKGQFQTDPIFTLYCLGAFPALLEDGNTSITMDVYAVDDVILKNVDSLEGYHGEDSSYNHYDRITIKTPFGDAYTYVYDMKPVGGRLVESGNWVEYKSIKNLQNA